MLNGGAVVDLNLSSERYGYHGHNMAINPSLEVGDSWCFEGRAGRLGIILSHNITLERVRVHASNVPDHHPRHLPNKVEVYALTRQQPAATRCSSDKTPLCPADFSTRGLSEGERWLFVGKSDLALKRKVQSIAIVGQAVKLWTDAVVLVFEGSWGDDRETCVYRIEVNGALE